MINKPQDYCVMSLGQASQEWAERRARITWSEVALSDRTTPGAKKYTVCDSWFHWAGTKIVYPSMQTQKALLINVLRKATNAVW